MPSEDRNDHDQIEHMLALILAIDVWWSWPLTSLNISSPPPPKKKKNKKKILGNMIVLHVTCTTLSFVIKICCILIGFYCLLEYLIIEVPSTHCGKQFDPEAQCLHRLSKYSKCWRAHCLVLNLKTLVYTTFMGVSHALKYLNELQVFKVEDGK